MRAEVSTGQDDHGHRIVVGADGSPSSEAALRWAVRQAEVLLRAARGADLLVVGSRGHGGFAAALGAVCQHCVRHASCPVVVVRGSVPASA